MRALVMGSSIVFAVGCGGSLPTGPAASPPREEVAPAPAAPEELELGPPPRVVPLEGVVSLSVGESHACAAVADGRVFCWGGGSTYRLGQGVLESSRTPVEVLGVDAAVEVAAGGSMSCAIRRDASVVCWGGYAQVDGDRDGIEWPLVKTPRVVAFPVAWTRQVSVGWVQASLLDAGGAVSILDAYLGPVPLGAFAPAREVVALRDGLCALGHDGRVQCATSSEVGAGGNGGGEGGYGEEPGQVLAPLVWSEALRPHFFDHEGDAIWAPCYADEDRQAPAFCAEVLTGATALDAHGDFACAVLGDGGLACWGCADCFAEDDKLPPLGMPAGVMGGVPFRIAGIADVAQVAVGARHVCALHRDGVVRCWGDDRLGQLGPLGARAARERAAGGAGVAAVEVPGLGEVVAIDAGVATTCALRRDGTVACWGHTLGMRMPDHEDDEVEEGEGEGPAAAERAPPEGLVGEAPAPGLVCRDVDVYAADGELYETRYHHDRAGRVDREERSRWTGDGLEWVETVSYERDRAGRVMREVRREARDDGSEHRWSIAYRHDRGGHVTWRKSKGGVDDGATSLRWDSQGRLSGLRASWGKEQRLGWRERPGEQGSRFSGLTLHESLDELRDRPDGVALVVRFAVDAQGRVVYQRVLDDHWHVLERWSRFDEAGRLAEVRESRFQETFYEEPLETWVTRHGYDASGRRTVSEEYWVTSGEDGAEELVLTRRTVHLAVGCE